MALFEPLALQLLLLLQLLELLLVLSLQLRLTSVLRRPLGMIRVGNACSILVWITRRLLLVRLCRGRPVLANARSLQRLLSRLVGRQWRAGSRSARLLGSIGGG